MKFYEGLLLIIFTEIDVNQESAQEYFNIYSIWMIILNY